MSLNNITLANNTYTKAHCLRSIIALIPDLEVDVFLANNINRLTGSPNNKANTVNVIFFIYLVINSSNVFGV